MVSALGLFVSQSTGTLVTLAKKYDPSAAVLAKEQSDLQVALSAEQLNSKPQTIINSSFFIKQRYKI